MKYGYEKLFLILLSAISIGIFTGCEDPELPQNKPHRENNPIITRFLFDADYCHDHLQYDTLYRIYSQAQMDSLLSGYDFWLSTLDFPNQSMYLFWGYPTDKLIVNVNIHDTTAFKRSYGISESSRTAPSLKTQFVASAPVPATTA
ncbi:MAG: hypothetical protein MJZ57_03735 [Bacteroidales bacterium]|nr:hypothetical protein [Bacteroidales bacterium]